jgi:hypothetical protein
MQNPSIILERSFLSQCLTMKVTFPYFYFKEVNADSMPSEISVSENAGTLSSKREIDLPTVKLDTMSKVCYIGIC